MLCLHHWCPLPKNNGQPTSTCLACYRAQGRGRAGDRLPAAQEHSNRQGLQRSSELRLHVLGPAPSVPLSPSRFPEDLDRKGRLCCIVLFCHQPGSGPSCRAESHPFLGPGCHGGGGTGLASGVEPALVAQWSLCACTAGEANCPKMALGRMGGGAEGLVFGPWALGSFGSTDGSHLMF